MLADVYVKAPPRRAAWQRADAAPTPPPKADPVCEIRSAIFHATHGVVRAWDPETGDMHYRPWERSSDPQEDAYRELVEMANVPLRFSEITGLDTPEPDPELEAAIEYVVHETWSKTPRRDATRRKRPEPIELPKPKSTPKPSPEIFVGEQLTSSGWKWSPVRIGARLRPRARLRP